MYSYEIDSTLKSNGYIIDAMTYNKICENSSQIIEIKYSSYEDYFEIWTNDGYYWRLRVMY